VIAVRPLALSLALLAGCTSDATGPQGALEQALAHARPSGDGSAGRSGLSPDASRTEARLTIAFDTSAGRHSLTIERRIDRAGERFRVTDARSYTRPAVADPAVATTTSERVESVYDGRALAWKRGDGRWIERDVLDGLADRTLSEARRLSDFTLAAFADYLRIAPLAAGADHPEVLVGARATWSSLELDPAVRPIELPEAELSALRDHDATLVRWIAATHRPTRVHGELARAADGEVLAAHLTIEGSTTLPDGPGSFAIGLVQERVALPTDARFELPADRLPEARERPWRMIEDVLGEGLLPPYNANR